MKRAFTLIELLIVIAIIGILSGILLASFSGGTESARAAKCLTNLRSLATAAQAYGAASGRYPNAGSVQEMAIDLNGGSRNAQLKYTEVRGWISWLSENKFPSQSPVTPPTLGFMGNGSQDDGFYAVTNGALFAYVSGNRDVYTCPSHVQHSGKSKHPLWSYFMNAYFKWDSSEGFAYLQGSGHSFYYGQFANADRFLLFGEIPFRGIGNWRPTGEGGGTEDDAVLQYEGCKNAPGLGGKSRRDGNEYIGGNHPIGRLNAPKGWMAHVVFADAHVEKINVSNLGDDDLRRLTTYLCTGKSYSISGGSVQELK